MFEIVAVVNQAFVWQLFKPGENPIGQHFGNDEKSSGDWEIVGVAEDTAYQSATWKDHTGGCGWRAHDRGCCGWVDSGTAGGFD